MNVEEERKQYEEKKALKKLKNVVAPTIESRRKRVDAFKSFAYYMVIGIVLLIVTVIVPFLSGGITANDFGYYLPKSVEGWVVFWAIRVGTVVGNITVYGLFKAQAKTNIQHDPNYIKAVELLNKMNGKDGFIPISPKQKAVKDWTTKGIFMFITTLAESIVIGTLIVNFDIVTFISSLVSSVTAVLFGIVQMIKDEVYWTEEYLLYAEYITQKERESTAEQEVKEEVQELAQTVEVPAEPEKEESKECLISETKNSETCKSKS